MWQTIQISSFGLFAEQSLHNCPLTNLRKKRGISLPSCHPMLILFILLTTCKWCIFSKSELWRASPLAINYRVYLDRDGLLQSHSTDKLYSKLNSQQLASS